MLAMLAEIRALDPSARRQLLCRRQQPIPSSPDVEVRARPPTAAGRWSSIRKRCHASWSTRCISPRVSGQHQGRRRRRNFLSECLQNANWLTRSLDQRARTILKVATEIVRQQDAFLAARRRPPEAAQPAHRRRRDRHARIDGEPRHRQQVHADDARRLRATLLLHRIDRRRRRRRGALLGGGARPYPPDDRRRGGRTTSLSDDAIVDIAEEKWRRHRPPHGRQVPGRNEHPSSVQRRREKRARASAGR
jgi:RNA polymerase sigma-54 factor